MWNNYLGGSAVNRPFGTAILDGVDFFIEESTTKYWDMLAETLTDLGNKGTSQIELSATPKCHHPDKYLGTAIQTGLFNYVQVRFYNESCCQYDGSFDAMKSEWDEWIADNKVHKVFVGVTASAEEEGYVDAHILINNFLKDAVHSTKFGGVMVWYRYTDHNSEYSEKIKEWNSLVQTTTPSRAVS